MRHIRNNKREREIEPTRLFPGQCDWRPVQLQLRQQRVGAARQHGHAQQIRCTGVLDNRQIHCKDARAPRAPPVSAQHFFADERVLAEREDRLSHQEQHAALHLSGHQQPVQGARQDALGIPSVRLRQPRLALHGSCRQRQWACHRRVPFDYSRRVIRYRSAIS